MSVLLLRFTGPMQSWGLSSRFTERDTAREPTKSGVLGLVCAALGKPREERPDDGFPTLGELASLRMGVRVDREGLVRRDFQTAGGGEWPGRKDYGVAKASGAKGETVISNRYYLADAVFLVGLEGKLELLGKIEKALVAPVWPLFLGRKSFAPAEPVLLQQPAGLLPDGELVAALKSRPLLGDQYPRKREDEPASLRLIIECQANEDGESRQDVPVSFESHRRVFTVRRVREESLERNAIPKPVEAQPCT